MASTRFLIGVTASLAGHVVAFAQMSHARTSVERRPPPVVIEVDPSPPPPPPLPLPEPEPPAAPPAGPSEEAPVRAARPRLGPSAPAAAGKIVAAADDAAAVADFTMIQGSGPTYGGGVTTSTGTSPTEGGAARPNAAAAAGAPGGGAGVPAGQDRTKRARPVGSDWDCSSAFPPGASTDSATVLIVVRVAADGRPETVTVVSDPGQGFGAAARSCAMRQRYAPAEDPGGRQVTGSTAPFRVRFTR